MKTRGDYAFTFTMLGCLSVVAGIACILLSYANTKARQSGGHDVSSAAYFSIFFTPVGVGLVFLRRIAAVLLSFPLAVLALWMIVASLFTVPFPWWLANIAFGILLLFPSWATWRGWSELR